MYAPYDMSNIKIDRKNMMVDLKTSNKKIIKASNQALPY